MSNTWSRAAAAALAIAALAVAGCGSDDGDGAAPSASVPAAGTSPGEGGSSAAPGGDPIVLGNIGSYSGSLATITSKGPDVLQAWAKATNAAGGLNGHPVKVVTVDDGTNPARALAGAKKLVEEDGAIAIIGQLSGQTGAFQKYLDAKGIPVVGGQSTDTPYLTDPNFFGAGSTLVPLLAGALQQSKAGGSGKLGVAYCGETPVCPQAATVLQGLGKALGIGVTTQKVSSSAPNYTAPCLALKGDGAGALLTVTPAPVGPRILDACQKQGWKPVSVGTGSSVDASWLASKPVDGTVVTSGQALHTDASVPGVKRFHDVVDRYAPGLRETPQFSSLLLFAWSGGELFAAAAKAGKLGPDSTGADVREGLYALKDETLGGIAPPLNFVEGKPGFSGCYFASRITGGAFEPLSDNEPICFTPKQVAALAGALG